MDDSNGVTNGDAAEDFESVLQTSDAMALMLAKALLEAEGIDCMVSNSSLGAGMGQLSGVIHEPSDLLVRVEDAERAREVLAEGEVERAGSSEALPATASASRDTTLSTAETITLTDTETGMPVGRISESDLQFLMDSLEEESDVDRDYYIDGPTIDLLVGAGARQGLAELLRRALGSRDGVEIRWSRA